MRLTTASNTPDNPGPFIQWLQQFPDDPEDIVLARYTEALTAFNRHAKWLEEHPDPPRDA